MIIAIAVMALRYMLKAVTVELRYKGSKSIIVRVRTRDVLFEPDRKMDTKGASMGHPTDPPCEVFVYQR
jgi:hypothetical protein